MASTSYQLISCLADMVVLWCPINGNLDDRSLFLLCVKRLVLFRSRPLHVQTQSPCLVRSMNRFFVSRVFPLPRTARNQALERGQRSDRMRSARKNEFHASCFAIVAPCMQYDAPKVFGTESQYGVSDLQRPSRLPRVELFGTEGTPSRVDENRKETIVRGGT